MKNAITSDDYVLGIWSLSNPGKQDWLAIVRKDSTTGQWVLKYRFRYYVDDKLWDSEDRKSGTVVEIDGSAPEDKMVELVEGMQKTLIEGGFGNNKENIVVHCLTVPLPEHIEDN